MSEFFAMAAYEQGSFGYGISDADWKLVEELIRDVESKEQQEQFLRALFSWWSVVNAFRKVEFNRMRYREALPQDIRWHRLCLSLLITLGESLLMDLARLNRDESLQACGVTRDDVESAVATLRANWDEWHSEQSPPRIASLQAKILGGRS